MVRSRKGFASRTCSTGWPMMRASRAVRYASISGSSGMIREGPAPALLEMLFDLLQSFPLRFRQEERGGNEIDYSEAREQEEHGRISVITHDRQEDGGERC